MTPTVTGVVGIDPGPIPGLVLLWPRAGHLERAEVLQCTHGLLPVLLEGVLGESDGLVLVQTETFVVSRRSGRSSTAGAGAVTRDLVGQVQNVVEQASRTTVGLDARFVQRPAARVKPWATDDRLERAGLFETCKGMRHARDAARHALYAAVHDGGLTDPISKEWNR